MQIFRLLTACMKINQIYYVMFRDTSQFSFQFCISFYYHDRQFFSNFLAEKLHFGQKEPVKVQLLRLLCALMKVHPIPQASFKTTRSRFIQILHYCSVSWKIAPLYFLAQTFILWTESNFQTFKWLGENSSNSLCHV